nr:hypothetical protein Iba_chr04eCG13490 [Ipomoea batatas]
MTLLTTLTAFWVSSSSLNSKDESVDRPKMDLGFFLVFAKQPTFFSSFRHLNACGRDLPSEGGGRAVGVSDGEIDGGDEFGRVVGDEDCLRNEGTGSDLLRL